MCYNQTAMASEPSAHVQNPNSYMHPLPCWNNVTNRYNTSSNNTTYVMFGGPQEDVRGVGYIILFSGLVLLLGMLYCLAMRAGMIEASIRREQIAAAIRHRESYSYDTMTAKERRQYIDRVLKVKTFGASDVNRTSSEHSAVAPEAANVSIAISKPLQDESGDSSTDIEDLSNDGCLDDVSLNDDDDENPKLEPCCAICLEKFRNGDEVSYSHDPLCSHEYHTQCIVEWLLKHMNCPYCRRSYIPIPPSVHKASMVITLPAEPHPSSSWDHAAMHPVVSSSSSPQILHSASPSVEPTFDIEMGEGAPEEALSRHSIPDGDERIAI